jgi:hypothetical protein
MKTAIGERSKVEISFLIICVGAVVWLLTHILPTEAMVNEHEIKIKSLSSRLDIVLDHTTYIRAKIDSMEKK